MVKFPAGTGVDPYSLGFTKVRPGGGNEVQVNCPYHDDKTPSASLNVAKGLFKCFTCGAAKNANQLAEDLGGEVQLINLGLFGYADEKEEDDSWRNFLHAPLAIDNLYLAGREVSNETVRRWGLRYAEGMILFPLLYIDNTFTGFQGRVIKPIDKRKYMFYGKRPLLWPMQNLPTVTSHNGLIIITEGVFAALRARSAGFKAFAVMGASSNNAEVIKLMKSLSSLRIIGAFDPDEAGYLAAAKFAICGIPVLKNPVEVDETSKAELRKLFLDENNLTTNYDYLLDKLPRKERLTAYQKLERVRGEVYG